MPIRTLPMRNIKLVLEYDGTNFLGWQSQATGRSVQAEITRVLNEILQEPVNLIGAGRTDAGVHARGQVANFRTNSVMDAARIQHALSGLLPDDIVVLSAREVPESFHARFDARERLYRYYISFRRSAIGRQYQWLVWYRVDLKLMKNAASTFIGSHDFEAFSKCNDLDHHLCNVRSSRWVESEATIFYEIRSDRFVRGMVRSLVGTMVDLGRGRIPWDHFQQILESRDRRRAGDMAPACGLFLEEVVY
jgi:tRNA pseudouridine38-40 synthase